MPKLLAYGLVSKPCKVELLEVGDSEGATRQGVQFDAKKWRKLT